MDGARWNREEHCVDDQIPVSVNYINSNMKESALNSKM